MLMKTPYLQLCRCLFSVGSWDFCCLGVHLCSRSQENLSVWEGILIGSSLWPFGLWGANLVFSEESRVGLVSDWGILSHFCSGVPHDHHLFSRIEVHHDCLERRDSPSLGDPSACRQSKDLHAAPWFDRHHDCYFCLCDLLCRVVICCD